MTSIAIIDHGAGNLVSITRALARVGATPFIVETPSEGASADALVLPGVGTTGAAMATLDKTGWTDELGNTDRPVLGICVGMQLFADWSEEDRTDTLGLVPGAVEPIKAAPQLPHMGWNDVQHTGDPLFAGIPDGALMYFVHSFVVNPTDSTTVIATTEYGTVFPAALRRNNVVGVQFHPERSGSAGAVLLDNFVRAVAKGVNRAA
jgi:imidazole glycerol-phosphate synthase subunit HisH